MNRLNNFNEGLILLVSYLLLPLQDIAYDPDQQFQMGEATVYTLYLAAAINLCVIVGLGLSDAYH